MSSYPTTVFIVILVWWLGTGVVLRLQQGLNPNAIITKFGIAGCACISLFTLQLTSNQANELNIFLSFFSAVVLWGCVELSYYLGLISGRHKNPCPPKTLGWDKFNMALGASIWHELLVLGIGLYLVFTQFDSNNSAGLYTYLVLWLMRWSAKLNLFLGVPNFSTSWIPDRLSYISSYIKTGTLTPFFFISVACAALMVYQLLSMSVHVSATHPMIYAVPAVLLILAIVEHLFMLVPFQELKMWNRVFNSKL